MPTYDLEDFLDCCQNQQNKVRPIDDVEKDAEKIFGLKPASVLLDFIGNGGLEEIEFVNSTPWRKNPDKTTIIYVDAYEFRTMCKLGYIAFMFSNKTVKWLIKSFHLSENTNPAIALALYNAGIRRD